MGAIITPAPRVAAGGGGYVGQVLPTMLSARRYSSRARVTLHDVIDGDAPTATSTGAPVREYEVVALCPSEAVAVAVDDLTGTEVRITNDAGFDLTGTVTACDVDPTEVRPGPWTATLRVTVTA